MTIPHYDNHPQNTQLSICPNCGHEVEDWAFCFYCGTNLKPQSVTEQSIDEVKPSETKTDNDTLEEIEAQQQEPEVNVPSCPNCGKEIGDWDFCFHCGANLKNIIIPEVSDIDTNNQLIETEPTLEKDSESENNSEPNDTSDTKANEPESIDADERIIVLEDENGNEIEYIFLDLIQYRGKEYVVLLPNDDSVELVTILQFEETSDGIEHYTSVENNFTLQVVFEILNERAKNDFNFID